MSRKPEAKVFRKWVTSEVLPSIRRNGGYMTPEVAVMATESPAVFMARALVMANEALNTLKPQALGIDPDEAQTVTVKELCLEFRLRMTLGQRIHQGHRNRATPTVARRWGRPATRPDHAPRQSGL